MSTRLGEDAKQSPNSVTVVWRWISRCLLVIRIVTALAAGGSTSVVTAMADDVNQDRVDLPSLPLSPRLTM